MRNLTAEEKKQSQEAKKRANKQLLSKRLEVKGLPAIVSLDGVEITLNYELLYRLIRRLKNRHWNMKIERISGSPALVVTHLANWGQDKGFFELYNLPSHQMELLYDLPVIEIDL
ncbi:hypothetical protein J6TS7_44660 [Paenibacillus dendritiformis]|uniref:hypothetical protein n=1 Tax=Paenibacillus TaxID=44249 RepID=UPI001B1CCE6F|nr:hypothetical protein [Paenibacillus dendritiformis]GIO80856.1 hypothetical protein J6TS7_44660 [Paenibacillus dendritiformis]